MSIGLWFVRGARGAGSSRLRRRQNAVFAMVVERARKLREMFVGLAMAQGSILRLVRVVRVMVLFKKVSKCSPKFLEAWILVCS